MTTEPYAIRIFVPTGNPEGIRLIERFNRNGKALVFSRSDYEQAKERSEFNLAAVYLLSGYGEGNEDKPMLYIGQTDNLKARFKEHMEKKLFWDKACVFVMTENMDKGRTAWLEHSLIKRADALNRYMLDNVQRPLEPNLSEADKAETDVFLKEMLQVLPLIGIHAFEETRVISPAKNKPLEPSQQESPIGAKDLIIVPANDDGFERVFLNEHCWYAIRIGGGILDKLKWIAAYQTRPVSAITHLAEIDHIEPYGEEGKYKVVFTKPAQLLETPIALGNNPNLSPQAPRYASHAALTKAKTLQDLFK